MPAVVTAIAKTAFTRTAIIEKLKSVSAILQARIEKKKKFFCINMITESTERDTALENILHVAIQIISLPTKWNLYSTILRSNIFL